jgi:hypothetical protein
MHLKEDGKTWNGLIWLKTGTNDGLMEMNLNRFLTLEDGTDGLSRNVDKELPLLAAK